MYFDLQVNGYAGVDFNQDDLSADQLHIACTRMQSDGVESFLPTIITEHLDIMSRRLARLAELRDANPLAKSLIPGFHIEGPFINETNGYKGAHPVDAIRPADEDSMKKLLDAANGLTKLVTLAPERDPGSKVTRLLAKQNITISAGHSDASLDDLKAAADAGLTLYTHLGNGCPMQIHRHDNIIQRILSLRDRITPTFIADGAHVPFFALKNYLDLVGTDKAIIVTDAIAPAGLGPGKYTLGRWELVIKDDMVARAPDGSHLVGSAMSMPLSARNLKDRLHLSDADIKSVTYTNPRRVLHV
jgi:N-acetylglucosamine-6-phosphate deacetylase